MSARPWRAAAFLPAGGRRIYLGRAAARSEAGLRSFRQRWEGMGATVDAWEVLPHPEVEALLTQHAQSRAG